MAYWEVWEKLILNKPVTLQGKCKQEKNGVKNTKTVSAHSGGALIQYLLNTYMGHSTELVGRKEEKYAID